MVQHLGTHAVKRQQRPHDSNSGIQETNQANQWKQMVVTVVPQDQFHLAK